MSSIVSWLLPPPCFVMSCVLLEEAGHKYGCRFLQGFSILTLPTHPHEILYYALQNVGSYKEPYYYPFALYWKGLYSKIVGW